MLKDARSSWLAIWRDGGRRAATGGPWLFCLHNPSSTSEADHTVTAGAEEDASRLVQVNDACVVLIIFIVMVHSCLHGVRPPRFCCTDGA